VRDKVVRTFQAGVGGCVRQAFPRDPWVLPGESLNWPLRYQSTSRQKARRGVFGRVGSTHQFPCQRPRWFRGFHTPDEFGRFLSPVSWNRYFWLMYSFLNLPARTLPLRLPDCTTGGLSLQGTEDPSSLV